MSGIASNTATFAKIEISEVTTAYDATRANHAEEAATHNRKNTE